MMENAPMPTEQEYQEQMRNFEINDRPPSSRHSRAFRNFKNPPQPHMCIRDKTVDGDQEVFINVMSWTRIVKPQAPNDPIPLYGGMQVFGASSRLPSSQRQEQQAQISPQNQGIIFAVMANPEVLKKASRNSTNDQDLIALVELMCEFVETMNPGLKLLRQPEVLKDRDLSGELKNIWGAVQAKREKEREQFMFSTGKHNPNLVVYTELGPETAPINHINHSSSAQEADDVGLNPSGDFTASPTNGQYANGTSNGETKSTDSPDSESPLKLSTTPTNDTSNDHHYPPLSNYNNELTSTGCPGTEETQVTAPNNLQHVSTTNHHNGSSDRLKESSGSSVNGLIEDNVPHSGSASVAAASANAQQINNNKKTPSPTATTTEEKSVAGELKVSPVTVPAPVASPITKPGNGVEKVGKAEKEVANVKEKKEKSISGFLHNGLFGKRNKDKGEKEDKSTAATPKKEGKVKLGSFKSKLLLSGSKEKEDKGSEANGKKVPVGVTLEANMNALNLRSGDDPSVPFNEIGQSMTTAK